MEFILAVQQPPNVYEIYADLLKGQQVSLAWKPPSSEAAARQLLERFG